MKATARPGLSGRIPVEAITVAILLLPAMMLIGVFLIYPALLMLINGLAAKGIAPYVEVLTEPYYRTVFYTTIKLAFLTTLFCLILGYPVSYYLTVSSNRVRMLLIPVVILPYWLDYIVRSYSWVVILGREGLVNRLLVELGIFDGSRTLLYNQYSVLIGMVQIFLPMMILTLFGAMLRIDLRLMNVAAINGANRFRSFVTVFLPLSAPAIYGSSILVFVTALAIYVTPVMLGGPRETVVSQAMMVITEKLFDWPLASAAAILLVIGTLGIYYLYSWFFNDDNLYGAQK